MADERTLPVTVIRIGPETRSSVEDHVAVEEPLEIRLCVQDGSTLRYRSVSVTMRTPGADAELAAGFLFTEGILQSRDQIESIAPWGPVSGDATARNITLVRLAPGVAVDLRRLERNFYAGSSCGVCGKASLDAVRIASLRGRLQHGIHVDAGVLYQLPDQLRRHQNDFALTGGLHAAALFSLDGRLLTVREDVGRHNALDKLIGRHFQDGSPMDQSLLLMSSRASFELVQKAVVAGIPILAAVGAPSSLAIELAHEFDLTLIGFLRDSRFNIYSGDHRIIT